MLVSTLCPYLLTAILYNARSVFADASSDCPGQLQFQDGPRGFGTTYQVGNRILVNTFIAESDAGVQYTPKDYPIDLTVTLRRVNDEPGNRYTFHVLIHNRDSTVRNAQLAFSDKLNEVPIALFTVAADPHQYGFKCVVVGKGFVDSPVTIQGF